MKNLIVFLLLLLTSVNGFSQCAVFTPSMSITQVNPGSPPFGEDVTKAIDGNSGTKYLNFNRTNTGLIVNTGRSTIVNRMDLTTANDEPSRDPINYVIDGSNNGSSWTSITSGNITCNSNRFLTRSFNFTNTVSYSWYRITFPSLCNVGLANSMQIAEIQLYASNVSPSVSIARSGNGLCQGSSITFTATPTNGGTPTYQWRRNGVNVSGATSSVWTSGLVNNGDAITCVMTSNAACVSPTTATSNSLAMSVTARVMPSVSILGDPSASRKSLVTLQALPNNGGGAPTYKWYKNGALKSTRNPWTDSANTAGVDTIRVVMRTSLTCVTIDSAVSTYNLTVLSLRDVKYRLHLDSMFFEFMKDAEDIVSVYALNEKTGKSTHILSTANMTCAISHTSKYYYIISKEYTKVFGPFPLIADDPRKYILSTKQLLGQYTN